MERCATIMLHLEFSLKYKIGLQIGKLNSFRSDELHLTKRLLIESHLNFDRSCFMKKYSSFVLHLEFFFVNVKEALNSKFD